MGDATQARATAQALPEGDVIRVLLEQHATIRDLLTEVGTTTGDRQRSAFDALRRLIAAHEEAEETVLRPVTARVVGENVAAELDHEEGQATAFLGHLERMSPADPDFAAQLAAFEEAVDRHAETEEQQEFPHILAVCDKEERQSMGRRVEAAVARPRRT